MKCRSFFNSGVALVVVLSFLALLTVLAVAFFSGITAEVGATRQADSSARCRQFAELAVNVVMGQIRQATSRPGLTWASQPGMIRTFDSAVVKSSSKKIYNPDRPYDSAYYKLYSSNDMEVTVSEMGAFDASNEVPADWSSRPAQFTDLNAPCVGVDGTSRYPIFDPAAAAGATAIAGCSLSGSTPVAAGSQANPAPMPVRWIYVLRDGTLTSSTNGASTLTWSTSASTAYKSPSRNNPIIGRIAFWTDDETCKVNLNTASEGTYWDVPRANVDHEKSLGLYQPARREWQRYPGHPATTCLSTVFPKLGLDQIYAITPRVNGGGSNAGTTIAGGAIAADRDRLYASVDELMFNSTHTDANAAGLTQRQIEQARFFLTAHSRSPEVNLFGKPRIACWPISTTGRTPFDQAIALCSTIGGHPYYFQREDPNSPTHDIGIPRNGELYSYLQSLAAKAVPGFGLNFASKYPQDRDQILTEIFDYIRSTNLQDDNLPAADRFTKGGWVIPTQKGATMGFGRALTLSGLAIGFICNADGNNAEGSNTAANPNIGTDGNRLAPEEIMVQAVVVPDFFCVMQGWSGMTGDLCLKVSDLNNLKLNDQPLYASGTVSLNYTTAAGSVMVEGRSWGGAGGWRYFAANQISPTDGPSATFPLASKSVRIKPSGSTMKFSGGTITLQLCSLSGGAVYQTFTVNLPAAAPLPVPKIAGTGTPAAANAPETAKEQWWTFGNYGSPLVTGRVANASAAPGTPGNRLAGAFFREEYDVVRGVVLSHGDFRLIAGRKTVSDPANKLFVPLPNYLPATSSTDAISCQLSHYNTAYDLVNNAGGSLDSNRRYFAGLDALEGCLPYIYPNATSENRPEATGDFDNGLASAMDGPYINQPDEGNTAGLDQTPPQVPYFDNDWTQTSGGTPYFSPNRMIPSPGMFGSLPTGVVSGTAWRTLLLRPQGSGFAGKPLGQHPASSLGLLPDHLLLDLFWMPVVEPYAISEPFSTAGKVNLNYQIMPFTYIERSTALRAALKPEKLGVIRNDDRDFYKSGSATVDIRKEIDVNAAASATKKDTEIETLNQFAQRFASGELFKSASEICDLHIVPTGESVAGMPDYWNHAQLTGDNLRERIYTTLYPRLTTRSNTYTVHYRVQALKEVSAGRTTAAQWAAWNEAGDKVLSECRGSAIIERYVDPNQGAATPLNPKDDLPDFAKTDTTDANQNGFADRDENLDDYYRFRVLSTQRFTP